MPAPDPPPAPDAAAALARLSARWRANEAALAEAHNLKAGAVDPVARAEALEAD